MGLTRTGRIKEVMAAFRKAYPYLDITVRSATLDDDTWGYAERLGKDKFRIVLKKGLTVADLIVLLLTHELAHVLDDYRHGSEDTRKDHSPRWGACEAEIWEKIIETDP